LDLPVVRDAGRLITAADPISALSNNTHSLGMWFYEKVRPVRKLGFANLINPAGNRVSPSYESLLSAIDDFSSDASATQFINGTSACMGARTRLHTSSLRR
jgi:hypothetical protein